MKRTTLIHSFLIVAASAILTMPGAYAGPDPDEFSSQSKNSDGGGKQVSESTKSPNVAVQQKKAPSRSQPPAPKQQTSDTKSAEPAPARNYQEWGDDWR